MISIYNSVESPIKDIEILGNTVDGVSVGILQDDGQYKITLFTNNGLDNMSPDYREDKEELLLPCQLEKQGDSTDRLYYDKEEKAWCIYKVGQSKIVLPVTFTISLNSFYGTTNLYMVSGDVEGTIKAKVSKSLGASVSSLNDKADVLIDKIDAMLGGRVDLDGYATIEYVDVKDGEIKDILDNMFEEYGEEQISIDFPNASTISIVDNDDLFTSTTIEGALRELANNSGSGNAEGIKFDNSSNEMTSVNVQDAIEENKTSILNIENELSKSENTSYTTENGIKEFSCKDGYVDNVVMEGKTLVNLWDINKINVYEDISVEGNCVKIIANGSYIDGFPRYENGINFIKPSTEYTVIVNVIKNTLNGDIGLNIPYNNESCFEDSWYIGKEEVQYVKKFTSSNDVSTSITPLRTQVYAEITEGEFIYNAIILEGDYVNESISYFGGLKSVGQGDKIEVLTKNSDETKQDKKQILTTLRSLPNGVKDTIEKRGNKYYKIKRCEEIFLNGGEAIIGFSIANTVGKFAITTTNKGILNANMDEVHIISDKLRGLTRNEYASNTYEGAVIGGDGTINIAISTTKLSSQDEAGVKAYLSSNPVTVVYELATPIIEELPNFNPQTFSDKTTLLLNSGVVQGEVSFEVTNSTRSELEVLKGKVSDLDNYVVDALNNIDITTDAQGTSFDNSENGMVATNVQDAIEENKNNILSLNSEVDSLKLSVSNGKQLIASAITDKNISTSNTDSFQTMADNIKQIKTGINVKIDNTSVDYDFDLKLLREEWVSVSTMSQLFHNGRAVIYNNEIHTLGGYYSKGHYKYDGSSWTEVSTLPYDFGNICAVVLNNEIHIMGGADYIRHYKFDGESWTEVSTLPYNFYGGEAVIYNNEIHILGGGGGNLKHYKYNGSSWIEVSTLPYGFYYGCAVVSNNEIHIIGSSISGHYRSHYKYNGSSWTEASILPYDSNGARAIALNNEIHILGSNNSSYNTSHYKNNGNSWSYVKALPYTFYNGCIVALNNAIHILGSGYSSNYTKHYKYVSLYELIKA